MDDIIARHNQLILDIVKEEYYVATYKWTSENRVDKTPPHEMTDLKQICLFWNDFWFLLPDSPVIHRHPFSDVCYLAEGEYCEEDDSTDADDA
jgi:hypothetical protein